MFKKFNENKRKGFTLVELIVVLVILAILAALLIPALTGYIDKAKKKSVIAETRQAVMAAQTLVDEAYAKVDVGSDDVQLDKGFTKQQVADLAELDVDNIGNITVANGKIDTLVYSKSGKTCTYYADTTGRTTSDGNYDVK